MTNITATTTAAAAGRPTNSVGLTHRQVLVILSGLWLGILLSSLDQTIVATALPTIAGDLGGLDHISWVVTAYLLPATATMLLYGKLGDLLGRKKVYQLAIVIFLAGSVLCGLAQNMLQLILFRGVQGVGAGGLLVLAQASIADVVAARERARYQAYTGALFGTAAVGGPLLGGFFTDHASWRWVFFINIPIGLVALLVVAAKLPEGRRRPDVRIDVVGTIVLICAVTGLVLTTTWGGTQYAWDSPVILGLVAATVALIALFVVAERLAAEPLLPLRTFRINVYVVSIVVSFAAGMALFSAVSYMPLFLQVVGGASATNSGLLIVPLMGGSLVSSLACGRIISRTGRYRAFPVLGMALATVGMFLLSTMDASSSRTTASLFMVVLGLGIGCCLIVLIIGTQNAVPVADLGVATSSVNFFRSIGGSIGATLVGAMFNSRLTDKLAVALPDGLPGGADPSSLTPEMLDQLEPGVRQPFLNAFAGALTDGLLFAVPALVVAFAASWFMKEIPLRTTASGAHSIEL